MTSGALFSARPGAVKERASTAEHRSVRGRRSAATPQQRIALGALLVVAAVAGVLCPGAPTGHPAVDAVYRGAFVCLFTLAASRARRWTLAVAAIVPVVFGDSAGLLTGVFAVGISAIAAFNNARDRVLGASIGTLVAVGLLRLDVQWFTGSSAALAGGAAALVLWSGYRQSRRQTRRRVRRIALGCAGFLALGCALLGLQASRAAGQLTDAAESITAAADLAREGDTAAAEAKLADGKRSFDTAARSGDAWWAQPARLVPVGAQHAATVRTVAHTGSDLSAAALNLAREVDYDALRRPDGGIDLSAAMASAPIARTAAATLATTDITLADIDRTWLLSPLTSRLDEYRSKVQDYARQTEFAASALETVPNMLGAEGPRRYLFLLGNPTTLQELGGHIDNWAVLVADGGRLTLEDAGVPDDLSVPNLDPAAAEDGGAPAGAGSPPSDPQNWAGTVDMKVTADLASRQYQAATGLPVDGVAYGDPHTFAALLRITGPVQIPGTDISIDASSAVDFLTAGRFANPTVTDASITDALGAAFDRFATATLPSPRQLGELFGPLTEQGRLRFVSLHPQDDPFLELTGLADSFTTDTPGDALSVVNRTADPSGIDASLSKRVTYDAVWNPDTGAVSATVTVELRNSPPADGAANPTVGDAPDVELGSILTDTAVLTRLRASNATIDGVEAELSSEREQNGWRHSVRHVVPSGSTVRLRFTLDGEIRPGDDYTLLYGAQPTLGDSSASISVRIADSTSASRATDRSVIDDERFIGSGIRRFEATR